LDFALIAGQKNRKTTPYVPTAPGRGNRRRTLETAPIYAHNLNKQVMKRIAEKSAPHFELKQPCEE
jgi:hypothetical protein